MATRKANMIRQLWTVHWKNQLCSPLGLCIENIEQLLFIIHQLITTMFYTLLQLSYSFTLTISITISANHTIWFCISVIVARGLHDTVSDQRLNRTRSLMGITYINLFRHQCLQILNNRFFCDETENKQTLVMREKVLAGGVPWNTELALICFGFTGVCVSIPMPVH